MRATDTLAPFEFSDVWEWDMRDYTHRFKWCCYALSWAMQIYDKAKEAENAKGAEAPRA